MDVAMWGLALLGAAEVWPPALCRPRCLLDGDQRDPQGARAPPRRHRVLLETKTESPTDRHRVSHDNDRCPF